jgi:hypothetical protein
MAGATPGIRDPEEMRAAFNAMHDHGLRTVRHGSQGRPR